MLLGMGWKEQVQLPTHTSFFSRNYHGCEQNIFQWIFVTRVVDVWIAFDIDYDYIWGKGDCDTHTNR